MRVVIFGSGDVGTYLARSLSDRAEVILVDRSQKALQATEELVDALTVLGDATHRSVLEAAEIRKADLAVAVTGSDETNVVAAALAASMGARRTVARVDAPQFYQGESGVEAGVLGIHSLVCASRLVSDELFRLIERIDATFARNFAGNSVHVSTYPLREGSPALGRAATHKDLGKHARVAGVVRDSVLRPPETVSRLEVDDALLIVGSPREAQRELDFLRGPSAPRRAVIIGGGDVGLQLARMLGASTARVQVIELDRGRCDVLSEALPKVNVVHGDGTSLACLRDEQIGSADYAVAVTRADEVNLMASLMAIDLGVPRTFALVHRPGYAGVYAHLGIRGTAGTHDVIARVVDWLLPHAGAITATTVTGTAHQLLEFQLPQAAALGTPLSRLSLPAECWAVGVSRGGQAIVASPEVRLAPLDRLLVAAPAHQQREVEKRLRVFGDGGRS